MDKTAARALIDRASRHHRLLDHPFYRRWQASQLSCAELGAYAAQYRHFESALTTILHTVAAQITDEAAGALVERNLADEAGGAVSHLELFEGFAAAVGAPGRAGADGATRELLALYESADADPVSGLAALAAYEAQAGEVAATKAAGLRAHYGLDGDAVAFWDLHAALDADHADWAAEAIGLVAGDDTKAVQRAASRAARAWWCFLDAREADRTARAESSA
jgi:pyrroloquinoline-quinone synthase